MDPSIRRAISVDDNSVRVAAIKKAIDIALHKWGSSQADFTAWDTILALGLHVVEEEAEQSVAEENAGIGRRRPVLPDDRRFAAWSLVRQAITSLHPGPTLLSPDAVVALRKLPQTEWPRMLPVPPEASMYLFMMHAYVWRDKTREQIAELLGCGPGHMTHERSGKIFSRGADVLV